MIDEDGDQHAAAPEIDAADTPCVRHSATAPRIAPPLALFAARKYKFFVIKFPPPRLNFIASIGAAIVERKSRFWSSDGDATSKDDSRPPPSSGICHGADAWIGSRTVRK